MGWSADPIAGIKTVLIRVWGYDLKLIRLNFCLFWFCGSANYIFQLFSTIVILRWSQFKQLTT